MAYPKVLTAHIVPDQLTGDGDLIVTHDGGGTTAGNVPEYDANGNLTDSGTAPGGGGGASWSLAASWHHSVSGNTASPIDFTGLAGANDILVIVRLVSLASSGFRQIQLSVDNGSSFYSNSGDYVVIANTGAETAGADIAGHVTGTTAARTIIAHIPGAGGSGGPKINIGDVRDPAKMFVASNSPINAVRVLNNVGTNFTGGDIYVFTR